MRKRAFFAVVFCLVLISPKVAFAQNVSSISATKKALISELMHVSNFWAVESDVFVQTLILEIAKERGLPTDDDLRDVRAMAVENAQMRQGIEELLTPVFDRRFSEDELRSAIAFFKTSEGRKFARLQTDLQTEGWAILRAHAADVAAGGAARRRLKMTKANIYVLATALEAYATDINSYPTVASIKDLESELEPTYVRDMPETDGFDREFVYLTSSDQTAYRFVSGGADGKIDAESLVIGGRPRPGTDDFVYENGEFLADPIAIQ